MTRRMLSALIPALLVPLLAIAAIAAPVPDAIPTPEQSVQRFAVDGRDLLDAIVDAGYDVTHEVDRVPTGWEFEAVVSATDVAAMTAMGADLLAPGEAFDWEAGRVDRELAAAAFAVDTPADALTGLPMVLDEVVIGRVDYYTTKGQGFLSIEAKSTLENRTPAMMVTWADASGAVGGAQVMTAFTDSGEYMYHEVSTTVEIVPASVSIVSAAGGTATAPVEEWLYPVDSPMDSPEYQTGFIDGYMDPTELFDRIDELAALHPEVAEIVDLAHDTNGYQRKAQAVVGGVTVSSRAWGHEGGNDVTVEIVVGGDAITVEEDGSAVTITAPAGTSSQEIGAALEEQSTLVTGFGSGSTATAAGPTALQDFLTAPVERGPFDVRAIRIGNDVGRPQAEKPGVLILAQDHAREWVPPLVALEAVERLLANYETDPTSADIVDNVDVWVIPSNNPDGSHYSMYDYDFQRKNMTNHCAEGDVSRSGPGNRDSWGVDLNRGYSIGSRLDGFAGASGTCTSSTFSGYEELSEPEALNVVELVDDNPNIKFFMTIHSNGGQLFWQPGTYIANGRQTPTRPPLGDETYYWQMAERILSHVKTYQDTVVRPDSVGGSSDVLYSSAGNVREELYVNRGTYAFGWEVGGAVWNTTTRTWSNGSFQPAWSQAQGEYMEYASGITEMFAIAADYGRDTTAPTVELVEADGGFRFQPSEPARIFFTTDGSEPVEMPRPTDGTFVREWPDTGSTAEYLASGIRETGQVLSFAPGTVIDVLVMDPSGNETRQQLTVG